MQLKFLNFYKAVSNIATHMVGAFVPLIIYKYTGSFLYAFIYLFFFYFLRLVITYAFRKLFIKYPQIFLLIRAVPVVLYSICILLLDINVWVAIVGICIFNAFADAFSKAPNELVYNYTSLNKGSRAQGITLIAEKIGDISAYILGGLFLDYISQHILIIVSLVTYLISIGPLMVYFFMNRKDKLFNQEATSNAAISLAEREDKNEEGQKLIKKMLRNYFTIYTLYLFSGMIMTIFTLWIYSNNGAFSMVGYLIAAYNVALMLTSFISGKLDEKKDLTFVSVAAFVITGVACLLMPFVTSIWALFAIFIVMGAGESFSHVFLLERMRMKLRILGISNKGLMRRAYAQNVGQSVTSFSCCLGEVIWVGTGIFFGFATMFIGNILCAVLIPINEEKTRKMLVKYLQNN